MSNQSISKQKFFNKTPKCKKSKILLQIRFKITKLQICYLKIINLFSKIILLNKRTRITCKVKKFRKNKML